MALIPYQPQNLTAEQTDGNILLNWTGSLGATSYQIQRGTDGVNFTNLATSTSNQYLDSYPGVGITYYYQVAGVSVAGTSVYSSVVSMVAAPPGEMSLGELRLRSQQDADRVGSTFIQNSEWNSFLRLAMYELYDLLVTSYEDYNIADPAYINTNGTTFQYELPNGINYKGGILGSSTGTPAQRLYKIAGIDLGVNTSNNAWVTIRRFDWIDRNNYVYPNSTSTIYGVYNMRYRPMGAETFTEKLMFIPIPSGNQQVRIWYAPVLKSLLADNDLTTIGYSGWLRYVIVRASKYALDKEEGVDTQKKTEELVFLKQRIEQSAQNRDQGQADTISNTRRDGIYGNNGDGGANGGWAIALLLPILSQHNIGNNLLANSIFSSQFYLGYFLFLISFAYFLHKNPSQFGSRIIFSGIRNLFSKRIFSTTFRDFISHIIKRSSKK